MPGTRSRTRALSRARVLFSRAIVALTLSCGSLVLMTTPGRPVQAATGLPTHFGIGVGASPNDIGASGWTTSTRIPFDYVYQYLSAGVNTGIGWETWNANGQFPLF